MEKDGKGRRWPGLHFRKATLMSVSMARRLLQPEGHPRTRRQGTSEMFHVGIEPRLEEQGRGPGTSQASGLGRCMGCMWFNQGAPASTPWALLAQPGFQPGFVGGVIPGRQERERKRRDV